MATEYLSNLNQPVKINSAQINNAASRDALLLLSKRNAGDLNRVADYINMILVPAFSTLASKPSFPYDAVESGLSGNTIVSFLEADGNSSTNSPLFWKSGVTPEDGRPCTIKESFDYLLSTTSERILELRESNVDLGEVWGQIACNDRKITQVKTDTLGEKYFLSCNSEAYLAHSLSKHIREILTQLTNNPDNLANELDAGSTYPTLSLNANLLQNATEVLKGVVEKATVQEVSEGTSTGGSEASLFVSPDNLLSALNTVSSSYDNNLRNQLKKLTDIWISESNIGVLNNVNTSGAVSGEVLMFDGSEWVSNSVSAGALLGTDTVVSSLSDVNGLVDNNYEVVVFEKASNANVKEESYKVAGLNASYIFSEDGAYKSEESTSLRKKKIPFVFRHGPMDSLYDNNSLNLINSLAGTLYNNFGGKVTNAGLGQQGRCSVYNDVSQTHLIEPHKVLGVTRSDIEYGNTWVGMSGTTPDGTIESGFDLFMRTGNTLTIQESGTTPLMIIGPHKIGELVYLCPERILEMFGIQNGLGIGITESFFETPISTLSGGAVSTALSLMDVLLREQSETYLTTLNELEIKSKPLGVVVNKIDDSDYDLSNPGLENVHKICYALLEANPVSGSSEMNNYLIAELTEVIGNSDFVSEQSFAQMLANIKKICLPIVKLLV
jgi:hypothetical protein